MLKLPTKLNPVQRISSHKNVSTRASPECLQGEKNQKTKLPQRIIWGNAAAKGSASHVS